jgi:hypothetical protein
VSSITTDSDNLADSQNSDEPKKFIDSLNSFDIGNACEPKWAFDFEIFAEILNVLVENKIFDDEKHRLAVNTDVESFSDIPADGLNDLVLVKPLERLICNVETNDFDTEQIFEIDNSKLASNVFSDAVNSFVDLKETVPNMAREKELNREIAKRAD